jgi:hypothetical protein
MAKLSLSHFLVASVLIGGGIGIYFSSGFRGLVPLSIYGFLLVYMVRLSIRLWPNSNIAQKFYGVTTSIILLAILVFIVVALVRDENLANGRATNRISREVIQDKRFSELDFQYVVERTRRGRRILVVSGDIPGGPDFKDLQQHVHKAKKKWNAGLRGIQFIDWNVGVRNNQSARFDFKEEIRGF